MWSVFTLKPDCCPVDQMSQKRRVLPGLLNEGVPFEHPSAFRERQPGAQEQLSQCVQPS